MKKESNISFFERMINDTMELDWSVPQEFPDLTNSKFIAIDLETCDPNLLELGPGWVRNDGFIVGVAVAAGDFEGYYPFRHEGGGNIPEEKVFTWLKKQLATPHIPKIMHNASYDAGWLRWAGIKIEGQIYDTMVAGALIDENRFSYALNSLTRDYLNLRKDEKILRSGAKDWGIDPKKELWRLPSKFVGHYAEQDAALTLKLWNYFETEISKMELDNIFKLETNLLPLMLDMRQKGVRIDLDKVDVTKKHFLKKVEDIKKDIKHETGIQIEPWVASSVGKVLDFYNIKYEVTEKSKAPSITKLFLQNCPHPVADKILKLREADKASSTFLDSITRHEYKGRIHCEYHQLRSDDGGTVTGRFSSSNPNLQQIPSRDPEIKKLIRGLFLPEQGEQWGSFDYSSQEPRLLVHYCSVVDPNDSTVVKMVEDYKNTDVDFHQMVADLADITRKEAKTVNLGIMYGMGKKKLGSTLGLNEDESKLLLENYHLKVPFVKSLADQVANKAQSHGQIRTLLGRLCRFNMWEPKSFGYNQPKKKEEAEKVYGHNIRRAFTYKALNRLIQGSAADQTKQAMLDCYAEGYVPLLTVHDELCFSIMDQDQADHIKKIMETGTELNIPSKVDQELGNNWGEIE